MVPLELATARLLLRAPRAADAPLIFARYASDPEVTRYLAWPRHVVVDQTRAFLAFSDAEWQSRGCGPYLIWSRDGNVLLGSTGLQAENAERASTGYVLAADAWGRGYATEALRAMIEVAEGARFRELDALCHVEHKASAHVLEKCGFAPIGIVAGQQFPNLSPPQAPALHYRLAPGA